VNGASINNAHCVDPALTIAALVERSIQRIVKRDIHDG
jgi:hypothetical protein